MSEERIERKFDSLSNNTGRMYEVKRSKRNSGLEITDEFRNQFSNNQKIPIEDVVAIAPWLLDADFRGAVITINKVQNVIVWDSGDWLSGTWKEGEWQSGTWHSGDWIVGDWFDGIWLDGNFKGGFWRYGIWENGNFTGDMWNGGILKDGTIDGEYSDIHP